MSEQQSAFPVDYPPVEALPHSAMPGASVVPTTTHKKSFAPAIEALKWVFSFPAMLGVFLVGRVFYQLRGFFVDPDVWWHMKDGQTIAATHHWPTVDPYSFTVHGTPWLAYEWLGDVAIGFVGNYGLRALAAFLIALGCVIVAALYYYATLCAGNSKAGFVSTLIVSTFAIGNFNLRPQMFGALFLVITLIVLELFRQGRPRALWILPPLFLLWVNAHGSWIIGLGVILVTLAGGLFEFQKGSVEGVRWTEKQRIQLELAFLGSLAVIPLTPYGTELAAYPFMVASSLPLNVENVVEWFPMPFNIFWGKLFLALLVGVFVLQALYQFKFRLQLWMLAIGGIVMACLHVRFVLLFSPFFAPIVAIMLARWIDKYKRDVDKYAINFVLMAGVVFAMIWYFPTRSDLQHRLEKDFPVRAVDFIHSHPVEGPLYNDYNYGGYLVAYLPEHKVFIDGRGDLYELGGAFADYLQIARLQPAGFSVLKSYGIRTCLIGRGTALAVVLEGRPDWKKIYSDDTSVIFVRRDSGVAGDAGFRAIDTKEQHESSAD
jgi:hypothetical protein